MTVVSSRPLPFAVMALLGFAVFGYATGVPMAPWAPVLGERLAELTCFQLAFTAERALALLEADPGVAPLLAGLAAVLKYLLLSVPVPAYGIAGSIRGMRADRRPGAIFIYVLVVAHAVAFVARPLQQIPACF